MIFINDNNKVQDSDKIKEASFGRKKPFYTKSNYQKPKKELGEIKLKYKKDPNSDYIRLISKKFFKNNKGKYIIICNNKKIKTNQTTLKISDSSDIIEIKLIMLDNLRNAEYMFYNCTSLISLSGFSNFKFNNLKNMKYMFANCTHLKIIEKSFIEKEGNINIITNDYYQDNNDNYDYFNYSSNKSSDFYLNETDKLTLSSIIKENSSSSLIDDIELFNKFKTEKIKDLSYMFLNCKSLISFEDLKWFNTKNVENMSSMFYGCSSLKSLPDILYVSRM